MINLNLNFDIFYETIFLNQLRQIKIRFLMQDLVNLPFFK